jgi:PAS domain S-box-containing protein
MDAGTLRNRLARLLALLAAAAGISALLLLARSVENSAEFSRSQLWILVGNAFAVVVLGYLLARKVWQLVRDYRNHVPGSRLTVRTVSIFGALVAAPLLVVYLFSMEFLNRGIDSWFQVEIKQGLNDALVLSRSALDLRLRDQSRRTESFARQIGGLQGRELLARLEVERKAMEVAEIVVYEASGRPVAVSSSALVPQIPGAPPKEILMQIGAGRSYVSLQPGKDGRYTITTANAVSGSVALSARRYVLVTYEVPKELAGLAEAVQHAYTQYGDLSALRQPLKYSFQLALTLVLLLTLLAAIYGAIFSAQRLSRPVHDLIEGTRAVGKGDFGTRLPLPSRDEMGILVHSFNDMTKRLRRLNEEATASKQAVERERERLAVILSRLSSGVLVLDGALRVLSVNPSASNILGGDLAAIAGNNLTELTGSTPLQQQFVTELRARLNAGRREWREQLNLPAEAGGRVLLWACTPLPDQDHDKDGGLVIVFEDITVLLTAQRNAAWGEVARRLAHEIKNPLTPIQLSAERLRRKLHTELTAESAQLLDRATHTIVQQVDAMQQMVNAFSEYARSPDMSWTRFSLNQLVTEVAELYRLQDPAVEISLDLAPALAHVEADRGRMRQLLANLISNALQAVAGVPRGCVEISTRLLAGLADGNPDRVQLQISDNGAGFREDLLHHAFEPYVTSKARGTGLGLAIVQRIVEEHNGQVEAENRPQGGARVCVILPLTAERRAEPRRERA